MKLPIALLLLCLLGCASPSNEVYVPPGVEVIEIKAVLTDSGVLVWSDLGGKAIHFELKAAHE